MKYAVIIEKSETGYGAYVPDLPGCIATGQNLEEVKRLIREAIEFHIEGLNSLENPCPSQRHFANTWKGSPCSTAKVSRNLRSGRSGPRLAAN